MAIKRDSVKKGVRKSGYLPTTQPRGFCDTPPLPSERGLIDSVEWNLSTSKLSYDLALHRKLS
jgi:hypothetical protein